MFGGLLARSTVRKESDDAETRAIGLRSALIQDRQAGQIVQATVVTRPDRERPFRGMSGRAIPDSSAVRTACFTVRTAAEAAARVARQRRDVPRRMLTQRGGDLSRQLGAVVERQTR